jgi:hypothetical protein
MEALGIGLGLAWIVRTFTYLKSARSCPYIGFSQQRKLHTHGRISTSLDNY